MVAAGPQGEHDEAVRSGVDELAAHRRADAHQAVSAEHVRDAFHQQRQLAVQHDVDLLLMLMGVDAPALAGLQHDEVHPEGTHAELTSQRLEALAAVAIERSERDVGLDHRASLDPAALGRRYAALGGELIEAPIDNWVASFDGRVLEIFTPHKEGSMRFYVRLLEHCAIDGNVLSVVFQRREQGFWPFNEDQRAQVEALVQAVQAARGS